MPLEPMRFDSVITNSKAISETDQLTTNGSYLVRGKNCHIAKLCRIQYRITNQSSAYSWPCFCTTFFVFPF